MPAIDERPLKWVWRGSALGVLGFGIMFILIQNSFHITASVVYVCLAYTAGVGAVYALFRMGASAVATYDETDDPEAWGLPQGARDELEREKRTLLKAIKEAELDFQMGKLSKLDFDEMVRVYRLRAIEVIKLLEGTGGSPREQIRREVKARAEVAAMHEKVERAHAAISNRKNPAKAAAAAQAAAREAAAKGATAAQVQAAAKAAAAKSDEEDEAAEKAAAKAEKEAEKQAEREAIELANADVKAEIRAEHAAAAKADDKQADDKQADDKQADDKQAGQAEAKADDKNADANADKADTNADKVAAKADDKKADEKADKKPDLDAKAETRLDAKTDDKPATKEATS